MFIPHLFEREGEMPENPGTLERFFQFIADAIFKAHGTVWLATTNGLFRIVEQSGLIQGEVKTVRGTPIVGADVVVLRTPFRTVTDLTGNFMLRELPSGIHRLQINGRLAIDGPCDSWEHTVEVENNEQLIGTIMLSCE